MIILGINQVPGILAWLHDSAAAVVRDGKIIASAEEERFNRQRHARGMPREAIEYCLKEAGITLADVDIIAISHNPFAPFKPSAINLHPANLLRDIANLVIILWHAHELRKKSKAKVVFVDHHLAHAASAYFCSGFDRANVLTIDGSGETESHAFFMGERGRLRRVWDIKLGSRFTKKKWHSIGMVYTRVTALLNLGAQAEGKTMGLASYGTPRFDFSTILNITDHTHYTIDRRNVEKLYGQYARRDPKEPLTQDHKDIAASLQAALERSIVNLARDAYAYSGVKNFALAGGVSLNCNTNTKILEQDFCEKIFIQPAASDGGLALGAALEVASRVGDAPMKRLEHAYLGPGFSDEEIEIVLKEAKIKYTKEDAIEERAAELVAAGKIVGWFQGRMEIGPRALGNRSILGNPAVKGMDERINRDVKHREVWRPFAPSLTEDSATTYFEGVDKATESPFMLHTFYVKKEYRDKLPSITHVDGSSRIQTVRPDQNERYYRFLKALERRTGYPIVLNTSFNDKGEPIVCSPKDALKCFYGTGFDALAIGSFLVEKP